MNNPNSVFGIFAYYNSANIVYRIQFVQNFNTPLTFVHKDNTKTECVAKYLLDPTQEYGTFSLKEFAKFVTLKLQAHEVSKTNSLIYPKIEKLIIKDLIRI